MTVTTDALLDQLDTLIKSQPGMMGRLEEQHADNGRGQCAGCVQYQRPSLVWPCNIIQWVWAVRQRSADRT